MRHFFTIVWLSIRLFVFDPIGMFLVFFYAIAFERDKADAQAAAVYRRYMEAHA